MDMIHYHFASLPSTNDWAKAHLETFDRDKLTLVTADMQTAGRGKFNRSWVSPDQLNLYATFCFFLEEVEAISLTQLLALSTANALKELGVICRIKWPNDLLVDEKKIAGVLCETVPIASQFGVVIGLGLNVNMPENLLATVGQPATSLMVHTGKVFVVQDVLEKVTASFIEKMINHLRSGNDHLRKELFHLENSILT